MSGSFRILADGQYVGNDSWDTGINNNDLIIGVSGAGKTRGYVKPNLLQCGESLVITDTKGSLHEEVGGAMKRHGYAIRVLDLTDCLRSPWGYNPLSHIRYDPERDCYDEQDIMTLASVLVPVECSKDPFWDYAAQMLAECIISYVLELLPKEEMTLTSVGKLLGEMGPDGGFHDLMTEASRLALDSFVAMRYKLFRSMTGADRMISSIQGILAEKLSSFLFAGAEAMFLNPRQISFEEMGRRKTAVFLHLSDTNSAMDKMAAMFYTQALQGLCNEADHQPGHRLRVPVRFILDDFAAAADACIPSFDKVISTIRSREISVSIILQSLSQLEASYGSDRAKTIINNCDNLLYLGGQDVGNARYVSSKANKPLDAVLQMPLDSAWLFTRGKAPRRVKKYDLKSHPRYSELPEAQQLDRRAEHEETVLLPDV